MINLSSPSTTYDDICFLVKDSIKLEKSKDRNFHFGFKTWDDIGMEIIEHIYSKLNHFNPSKKLKPWITKIVKNQIINKKRDSIFKNNIEKRVMGNYAEYLLDAEEDSDILKQIYSIIVKNWKSLSKLNKRLCIMRFKQKKSYNEIQFKTGLNRKAIYRKLSLIKKNFIDDLTKERIHLRK